MARRKRISAFSLSFLDIMSCGFGAVVLFFMIINHETRVHSEEVNSDRLAEVTRIELELLEGRENLTTIRNSLEQTQKEFVVTEGLAERIVKTLRESREQLSQLEAETLAREEHLNALKSDVRAIDEEARRLRASVPEEGLGDAARSFVGEGDRQYLTGLKVVGERVLILLDASASMLDETIVNIIRRRNMATEQKLASRKWQRAVLTVDWLAALLPQGASYQIYTFNTDVHPVIAGTLGTWLSVDDADQLTRAVGNLRTIVPEHGTSLFNVFVAAAQLDPMPDNIMLITDGLPTMGKSKPLRNSVSPADRLKHFSRAATELPRGVPVNVILLPMEGDPRASSAYWQLAQTTNGSFMAPARDWP